MTREEISQAIVEILSDIVPDEDWASLKPEDSLRGKLESMDFLDVVMELRKKYGVEVPEEDYGQLATLKSCADYLEAPLASK
ncbi:MAG: acyl carrier protein [Lentisphaerae bacterium]|jgi:acyl carrier protein|nr:acyl carrier protein [Lentisphaerota bacterium]OQC13941.1 MAG: acyl carrier protein [Lentisphaerae bacterium ADurb.Bin082]HOG49781.1 acyl carrier protein [Lentisphaeria bacterium]NMA40453.1 acyl carrier protein [Lentisphaerota bacterium]HPY90387.1 acyl carrier protein [Lentisphaeria bacterium]